MRLRHAFAVSALALGLLSGVTATATAEPVSQPDNTITALDINKSKRYRTDCSGYVSMAWKLTTSRTTSTLDGVATKIAWASLQPGDMILRNGHVKLFEKWTSSAKTTMWIYEQGSTSTDMDHEAVTVASLKSGGYAPWKYKNIR